MKYGPVVKLVFHHESTSSQETSVPEAFDYGTCWMGSLAISEKAMQRRLRTSKE